jgi:hypothetical protein
MRRLGRLDVVAVIGLVAWLAFDLTARTVFGSVPWPQSVVDYRILYDASREVFQTHTYPAGYPYPPPAVAAHAATALLPFAVAAPLWLALTGLAALAVYLTIARTLALAGRPGAMFVLPLAHVAVAYYFQWDMRSINCNLVVLAAVLFGAAALAGGRDRAAGFWIALAVALKLLPVLLVPYLAWTRRWRAFGWAAGFSLVFWVGVPLAAFGVSGTESVYRGWAGEMTRATDPTAKHTHPILISLDKATLHLTADAGRARALTLAVCGVWVAVGLCGAVASRANRSPDGFTILAHTSLLVLGPVAVNPYLEAYHLVPLAVPAVVLLAAAVDVRQPRRVRAVAAVGFAVGLVIVKASSPWPLRGLMVNAQALTLCGFAVWVAWARAKGDAVAKPEQPATERPEWKAAA